ncbi:zinc alcohol dehydrogenase, putative [Trichophyton benhamiae CBS 112371]|uniref:Zinc alcohol dehydrogenase, putative n=1 Tax=Arthroderma benhamiae (strain ATCC MYA-4681 / CBS 112371) TaxID=663331 RepID=D4AWH9_ARTBC|nr:zinc alcohol dehydrogenase, putative [Trichophyton benhamiae CBS 112371]EFE32719.1 zinc alcohol dehydrogenase, putative [Trichophyton benhamiae CBS 112371]
MLSLNIPSYSAPSGYQLSELPKPVLEDSNDVIIRVHAASINPIDVKKANGMLKMAMADTFPYKIGYDCAGTVEEAGSSVSHLKAGDEIYTRLPEASRAKDVALKPPSLSFADAASIPLAAMTALQALRRYGGDLAGKTVLVPAGLGGTGLFACQLAKHAFKAGKVITTVSTSKIPKVKELLGEDTVDEIIDYTKVDPKDAIPPGTVDFLFDTMANAMEYLSLMRPKTGHIISVSTAPSGDQLQASSLMQLPHRPALPIPIKLALNAMDSIRKFRARRYGVTYSYMFLESSCKDLEELRDLVESGKLRTVVGTTASLRDLQAVREACQIVYSGRGGLGKVVINVVD